MKKILSKIKYSVSKSINKHTSSKKSLLFFISLFIFGVISFVSIFFITRGVNPETSELAFIENSILGISAGSVIPASCESYPTYGTAHSIFDTSGYCAGTVPVAAVCGTTHYSCAAGRDTIGVNQAENASGWTWHCGGYLGGADATNCSEAKIQAPTVYIQFQ